MGISFRGNPMNVSYSDEEDDNEDELINQENLPRNIGFFGFYLDGEDDEDGEDEDYGDQPNLQDYLADDLEEDDEDDEDFVPWVEDDSPHVLNFSETEEEREEFFNLQNDIDFTDDENDYYTFSDNDEPPPSDNSRASEPISLSDDSLVGQSQSSSSSTEGQSLSSNAETDGQDLSSPSST